MHTAAIEPQGSLPMIVKRTTLALIRTGQKVNNPVPVAYRRTSVAVENRRPAVAEPDMEMVQRLNEIAKRHPFSTYYKDRKHDPL